MSGIAGPQRRLEREDVIADFRPILAILEEVIADARSDASVELMASRIPKLRRLASRRRLSGTLRWMEIADGIVDARPRFPEGFGVETTDAQHNQSQFAFRYPGGVFTVRRDPHDEEGDEGQYLQEALAGLDFDEGLDGPTPNARAYLSVPPQGVAKLIVEHPTLSVPHRIALDELRPQVLPLPTAGRPQQPARAVKSTRSRQADEDRGS